MLEKKHSILIIDDDINFKKNISQTLKDKYHFEFIEDIETAENIFLFFKKPYDLIIMETVLGNKELLIILKKIRNINSCIPILIVTKYSNHDRAKEVCNFNISGYIEKSLYDVSKIEERVEFILNKNTTNHNFNFEFLPIKFFIRDCSDCIQ